MRAKQTHSQSLLLSFEDIHFRLCKFPDMNQIPDRKLLLLFLFVVQQCVLAQLLVYQHLLPRNQQSYQQQIETDIVMLLLTFRDPICFTAGA